MPRAQSADGVIHDFPEGTDPGVIDRVMKTYAMQHAPPIKEPHDSGLSSYLKGSLEGLKEAGRDIASGAKDIGSALMPGGDTRPAMDRLGEIATFLSGGLTSPIGPQGPGALAKAVKGVAEAPAGVLASGADGAVSAAQLAARLGVAVHHPGHAATKALLKYLAKQMTEAAKRPPEKP